MRCFRIGCAVEAELVAGIDGRARATCWDCLHRATRDGRWTVLFPHLEVTEAGVAQAQEDPTIRRPVAAVDDTDNDIDTTPEDPMPIKSCKLPSCERPAEARGLCQSHYKRAHRRGINPDLDGEELAYLFGELERPKVATVGAELDAADVVKVGVDAALGAFRPMLAELAAALGMEGEATFEQAMERVRMLDGERRRLRCHLDDIRCDILDRGRPLGDDNDPELTPRRLVRELLNDWASMTLAPRPVDIIREELGLPAGTATEEVQRELRYRLSWFEVHKSGLERIRAVVQAAGVPMMGANHVDAIVQGAIEAIERRQPSPLEAWDIAAKLPQVQRMAGTLGLSEPGSGKVDVDDLVVAVNEAAAAEQRYEALTDRLVAAGFDSCSTSEAVTQLLDRWKQPAALSAREHRVVREALKTLLGMSADDDEWTSLVRILAIVLVPDLEVADGR